MSAFSDWLGTINGYFKIGNTSGVRLKNSSGNLLVRNSGDTGDAEVTTSLLHVSGDTLEINSDAAETSADWKYTLGRPTSGMSADQTLLFPKDPGTPGQVLASDGNNPTQTSWVSAASTAACITADTTSFAFGSSSPISMFTLPANAVIDEISVYVDTAFDGTPTITVGVSGTASKYVGSSDVDLKTAGRWDLHPTNTADASTEALIITYSAGGATVGAGRVIVKYSVPA